MVKHSESVLTRPRASLIGMVLVADMILELHVW